MEMRRLDLWVGRLAAVAGLVYVILCSVWPLNASADSGGVADVRSRSTRVERGVADAAPSCEQGVKGGPMRSTPGAPPLGTGPSLMSLMSLMSLDRIVLDARAPSPTRTDAKATSEPFDFASTIVALAAVATLVLFRRWHDPHASLDA